MNVIPKNLKLCLKRFQLNPYDPWSCKGPSKSESSWVDKKPEEMWWAVRANAMAFLESKNMNVWKTIRQSQIDELLQTKR